MRVALITDRQRAELIANGERSAKGQCHDPLPVVKLFTPDAKATWLLSEIDPEDPDRAFGLCDVGLGSPELGYVSLQEIMAVRGRCGLPVERDRFFAPRKPLSAYAEEARAEGRIVED